MREDMPLESRPKSCKFSDQNVATRVNGKINANLVKTKSSSVWGSHLVKGFSTEKKNKPQTAIPSKKPPLTGSDTSNQKNASVPHQTRVRRSIIGDFTCSANSVQVHPHAFDCNRLKLPGTRDLFLELDHLRSLLRECKGRESKLQAELKDCKENPRISELEKELELKKSENEDLIRRVGFLEDEKTSLSERLTSLSSIIEGTGEASTQDECANSTSDQSDEKSLRNLEMKVLELRRVNKELQFQKRNLACRLSTAESQLASLATETQCMQSDMVAKVEAEASVLRHTNENLCKQVEGLQMSRLNEVEELVYLRWVNSCLRSELRNLAQPSSDNSEEVSSPNSQDAARMHCLEYLNSAQYSERENARSILSESNAVCTAKKVGLMTKLKKWSKADEDCQILEGNNFLDNEWLQSQEGKSPRRRHSISGTKDSMEDMLPNRRRQSDGFLCPNKEIENDSFGNTNGPIVKGSNPQVSQKFDLGTVQSPRFFVSRHETNKIMALDVEKRALRIPNPPPKPSGSILDAPKKDGAHLVPPRPPPPPPPPPKFSGRNASVMRRAPQVVEFYHSLMKRESRKDSCGGVCDAANVANVRSSMIGEIENRSAYLLAIKADVETQGEFVNSLIREVNGAVYNDIEDVVAFVKWLDDELCFLVDERAVLKHFEWPEKKADTLREAAFGYRDLKRLEAEVSHYKDDPRLPCDIALKKMVAFSEKMERTVYNILRTRDGLMRNCKEFQIPTDWILDTGIVSKIKFASVKLAKKYMKRVAMELQSMGASDKDPTLEYMLLQGVRFAFRIHQFAGGFDAETMHAFEELRNLAHSRYKK